MTFLFPKKSDSYLH